MFTLTRLYKHKCFSGHIIFRLYKVIALNMNIFSIYSGSLCILEWVHWEFFISLFLTLWRNQKVGKTCTLLMTLLGQKVIYYFVGYPLSNWKLCSSKKTFTKALPFDNLYLYNSRYNSLSSRTCYRSVCQQKMMYHLWTFHTLHVIYSHL